MKISTILNKIENSTDMNTYLEYIEECLKKGMTSKCIGKNGPVTFSQGVMNQLLDTWFPGYSELSVPERRLWILKEWPIMQLEMRATKKSGLYNPTHPVYKYFDRFHMQAFVSQRHRAKCRGIEWHFDFLTWIVWWIQTGHFNQRGVTNGDYQMCRIADTGPYSWDNVYCDTGKNNKQLFWDNKKASKIPL